MPNTWLIDKTDDYVLVTRRKPVRWDISAQTTFPRCHPLRLAHQIRQDVWRQLQRIKGFCPAVEIKIGEVLEVRAGGRVLRHVPPGASDKVHALLTDSGIRNRWLAFARYRT